MDSNGGFGERVGNAAKMLGQNLLRSAGRRVLKVPKQGEISPDPADQNGAVDADAEARKTSEAEAYALLNGLLSGSKEIEDASLAQLKAHLRGGIKDRTKWNSVPKMETRDIERLHAILTQYQGTNDKNVKRLDRYLNDKDRALLYKVPLAASAVFLTDLYITLLGMSSGAAGILGAPVAAGLTIGWKRAMERIMTPDLERLRNIQENVIPHILKVVDTELATRTDRYTEEPEQAVEEGGVEEGEIATGEQISDEPQGNGSVPGNLSREESVQTGNGTEEVRADETPAEIIPKEEFADGADGDPVREGHYPLGG